MASSRGTTAYGAIMLALTLVIMAAIVGLLVLMVYLCTNIAYKFIPDKAKKNVKRMFTRKKVAGADDEPSEPGIKRAAEHRILVPRRWRLLDDAALRPLGTTVRRTPTAPSSRPLSTTPTLRREPGTEREGAGARRARRPTAFSPGENYAAVSALPLGLGQFMARRVGRVARETRVGSATHCWPRKRERPGHLRRCAFGGGGRGA